MSLALPYDVLLPPVLPSSPFPVSDLLDSLREH